MHLPSIIDIPCYTLALKVFFWSIVFFHISFFSVTYFGKFKTTKFWELMDYIYYCLGILTLLTLGITFQSSIYKSAADDLDQHNLTDYIDTYRSVKDEFNRLKN